MPLRLAGLITLLTGLSLSQHGETCTVQWRDAAEMQAAADRVVVATITRSLKTKATFRSTIHKYRVEVTRVERGAHPLGRATVTFEDLHRHLRGETVVCPLKNGSGIEHRLRAGETYRLYLDPGSADGLLIAVPVDASASN